ncbi:MULTISPECIES: acyl-CoA thioesterase [Erythrobacter]|uniref:acyl-CoA thioesterase n=1 Tax=Erythrobacter TaxID=1041 RepID=UPI001F2BE9CB|nr:thioesterase family protein [Erythrobacter sp. SN021]MCF8882579.1 acyl-CoA thioesterase [Erythrobacter sp. SN021]
MFTTRLPLRFAHCDPAGIAYYPRYFELCDAAVEDWTAAVLGVDRNTMHGELGMGLPTVDLKAEFTAPSRLGDMLDFTVRILRIGRSSLDLGIDITCGGEARFAVRSTVVLIDLANMRAHPWPADFLDPLTRHALSDKDPS